MAQTKDRHYWNELRSVLVGGKWELSNPGKAPNGTPLTWPELLRKFRKHCGNADFAEVASQTQALALLLGSSGKTLTATTLDVNAQSVKGPFDVGRDSILPESRKEEGQASYNALKAVESTNAEIIQLTLAYYAYALDKPAECIDHFKSLTIPNIDLVRTTSTNGSVVEKPSAVGEVKLETAWRITEWTRGLCLKGMAHERLNDPEAALAAYLSAIDILRSLDIPKSPSTSTGKPNLDSFTRYRELWRWVERLLCRAVTLSAQLCSIAATRVLLREYAARSVHWPASFRTLHRSTVACLHLRALILAAQLDANRPDPDATPGMDKHLWLAEGRSTILDYQAVLAASTTFPRAGAKNEKVEEFVDLCVAVWEASGAAGEQAGWVIEVLWWATRLTFNCQRVFRHMTRLLHVSGDSMLAKRTLRLYVQLVSRERQGNDGHAGAESDHVWVETLIQGARMLCRLPGGVDDVKEAGSLLEKAKESVDRHDSESVANLALAEGIYETALALREQDPLNRSEHLEAALASIQQSVTTNSTPSGEYHLALALARAGPSRNIADAIVHARAAVEGDAKEIRYWHLLGLLLVASGDWKAARAILELGAEIEEGLEAEAQQQVAATAPADHLDTGTNGLAIRDFAAGKVVDEKVTVPEVVISQEDQTRLIEPDEIALPTASTLLQPLPDHPPPSRREVFEQAVQLRMSQLALTEFIEGGENSGPKWAEVFAWFADRRPAGADRRTSLDLRAPSVAARTGRPISSHMEPMRESEEQERGDANGSVGGASRADGGRSSTPPPSATVPITVTGASPPASVEGNGSVDIPIGGSPSPERQSIDRDKLSTSGRTGKKVQKMLKNRVSEGQKRISTISRRINNVRSGTNLRRTSSAPDFHAVLSQPRPYQASSIHSRRRIVSSWGATAHHNLPPAPSPPPPPLPPLQNAAMVKNRSGKERRLLSDLWLMSAANFRRIGKIEQARAAIQEAEVLDEENEAVWVQLGLYFEAMGNESQAIESFHKALFISADYAPAIVHLCRLYLTPPSPKDTSSNLNTSRRREEGEVDIAAGMLSDLTRGEGWDVPEAWYYLAKAMKAQGRKDRERECLMFSLGLVEARGVREINSAVGLCL